jgi:hypothetical protein
MTAYGSGRIAPFILNLITSDGSGGQIHILATLHPGERTPCVYRLGAWEEYIVGLDDPEKSKVSCPCQELAL